MSLCVLNTGCKARKAKCVAEQDLLCGGGATVHVTFLYSVLRIHVRSELSSREFNTTDC